MLPRVKYPSLAIGDFNSDYQLWGYAEDDNNGNKLLQWAEAANLELIFDEKDKPSFHSARWNCGYNSDLCFASKDNQRCTHQISRKVLPNFPHSQHRPICINILIP